ncbi:MULTISPECIES: hypothetical protein [Hyphobacterium]|uniref:Uncharacterized protein n=1 Tax=Hyphobacterium vulgare TaxID=1736751 RepID=A0ABV6ZW52_9PROT
MPPEPANPDLDDFSSPPINFDPWPDADGEIELANVQGQIGLSLAMSGLVPDGELLDLVGHIVGYGRKEAYERDAKHSSKQPGREHGLQSQNVALHLVSSAASSILKCLGELDEGDRQLLTRDLQLSQNAIGIYLPTIHACRAVADRAKSLLYEAKCASEPDLEQSRLERITQIAEDATWIELNLMALGRNTEDKLYAKVCDLLHPEKCDRGPVRRSFIGHAEPGTFEWALEVFEKAGNSAKTKSRGIAPRMAALETVERLCRVWEQYSGEPVTYSPDLAGAPSSKAGMFVTRIMKLVDEKYTDQQIAGWMKKAAKKLRSERESRPKKSGKK